MSKLIRKSVIEYCAAIGADPLLVQGAGGNVSWKDGDTLWIKASGTWLSDAAEKDIFVPVDLGHLRRAISAGNFLESPKLSDESGLRPSIETMLHALMPHPVVIHLHAVEILAHLVRHEFEHTFALMLDSKIRWANVSYKKPGAELARAVYDAISTMPDANVVFLQNHGVVVGGSDITELNAILKSLIDTLRTYPRASSNLTAPDINIAIAEKKPYSPVQDVLVHQLATDMSLFRRLASDWALYPDHVVFLGVKAHIYETIDSLKKTLEDSADLQELVFVRGVGVFVQPGFSLGKIAQLRCYFDVLARQEEGTVLDSLNQEQIADLLNWGAEQYRQLIAK